jgi:hypothetical protein
MLRQDQVPDRPRTNHPAIVGFLLPFLAAGVSSAQVLYGRGDYTSFVSRAVFSALIPLMLGAGLYASLRSLPLIPEKGDKDYAYSGLVLNIFFILLYLFALIYALLRLPS